MNKQEIISSLRELGLKPNKLKGQNFIFDIDAIDEILNFSKISPEDDVLEIGPGLGAISASLKDLAKSYAFVELEEKFARRLEQKLSLTKEQVIISDIRDYKLTSKKVIIGNIPYSISTEIILWCIENRDFIKRASFLMQKEFAERIAADPGVRKSSSISVHRAIYAKAKISSNFISGDSFYPEAKIESALLELGFFEKPKVESKEELRNLNKIVRACFQQRRKTILNSLQSLSAEEFPILNDKEVLKTALEESGLNSKARAENLSLDEWLKLVQVVY